MAILEIRLSHFGDWKSLSIAFLAISGQYTIGFFHYVLSMDMPNMTFIGEFMTQLETPQAFWPFLYKMASSLNYFIFWKYNYM